MTKYDQIWHLPSWRFSENVFNLVGTWRLPYCCETLPSEQIVVANKTLFCLKLKFKWSATSTVLSWRKAMNGGKEYILFMEFVPTPCRWEYNIDHRWPNYIPNKASSFFLIKIIIHHWLKENGLVWNIARKSSCENFTFFYAAKI